MVKFCRTIKSSIQYYNWKTSYRVYDHATANGRQLPIIKRPRKFSCCTLLEIEKISLGKKLCDICLKCFNLPLALFCLRLLERNSTVRKLKPRGKITAPTNFAEIYMCRWRDMQEFECF